MTDERKITDELSGGPTVPPEGSAPPGCPPPPAEPPAEKPEITAEERRFLARMRKARAMGRDDFLVFVRADKDISKLNLVQAVLWLIQDQDEARQRIAQTQLQVKEYEKKASASHDELAGWTKDNLTGLAAAVSADFDRLTVSATAAVGAVAEVVTSLLRWQGLPIHRRRRRLLPGPPGPPRIVREPPGDQESDAK